MATVAADSRTVHGLQSLVVICSIGCGAVHGVVGVGQAGNDVKASKGWQINGELEEGTEAAREGL